MHSPSPGESPATPRDQSPPAAAGPIESGAPGPSVPSPTCRAIAWAFMRMSLAGFGGTLPFARRELVMRERWLTDREFTDVLTTAQLLPGPNVLNVAIFVGQRFRGARGVLAAVAGLLTTPFLVMLMIGTVYQVFIEWAWVKRAFTGIAAAAAGLILATGLQLARALPRRLWAGLIALGALGAVGLLHWPLLWIVLTLAPIGIACAWRWGD